MSLAELVLGVPHQRVSLLMHADVFSVPAETDQEECARLMERYNLNNLPVVDDEGKLVGVLKLEDLIGVFEGGATEDIYRMIGVGGEEKALGPFWRSVRPSAMAMREPGDRTVGWVGDYVIRVHHFAGRHSGGVSARDRGAEWHRGNSNPI